jgi:hypothetical protein
MFFSEFFFLLTQLFSSQLHVINLAGHMSKESLSRRLAHANEVLPKIMDSAEKPLAVRELNFFHNYFIKM